MQSHITLTFLDPFEVPAHRRIMHSQMRRDLAKLIAMLLVCLKHCWIVESTAARVRSCIATKELKRKK